MSDRAARVWGVLVELYGQRLLTNFGTEPPAAWRAKFAELSDAQLAAGLRLLSDKATPYPPSLGEFVAACRGSGTPRTLGQQLDDDDVRRLSGPAEPARHGLPPGMSPIAYRAAELRASGAVPVIDGRCLCASSLPGRLHAAYFAGQFENAAPHRQYLRQHPTYRAQLEREFATRWGVDVDLAAVLDGWGTAAQLRERAA